MLLPNRQRHVELHACRGHTVEKIELSLQSIMRKFELVVRI